MRFVRDGRENMMVIRAFSKVYGLAGIRFGYVEAMPIVPAPLNRTKESFSAA